MIEKKDLYAKFGVKEYWRVDPKKQRVEIFENKKGHFKLQLQMTGTGKIRSKILKGFEAALTEFFSKY